MIAAIRLMAPGERRRCRTSGSGGWPPVSRLPSSVNGLEPAIGWVAPPGQRVKMPEVEVVELLRWAGSAPARRSCTGRRRRCSASWCRRARSSGRGSPAAVETRA